MLHHLITHLKPFHVTGPLKILYDSFQTTADIYFFACDPNTLSMSICPTKLTIDLI
jgi:hypothetical protein